MGKTIKIEYKNHKLPFKIVIDGVTYPNTQHNWDVIAKFNESCDEEVLDKLTAYSFDI